MYTPFISLEHMTSVFKVDQDWLFEKLLGKLKLGRHLILASEQDWGIKEYVSELGFQLSEKNRDIQICEMDMTQIYTPNSFLEHFTAVLCHQFPEVTSQMELDSNSMSILNLPSRIAQRKKIRIVLFLAN